MKLPSSPMTNRAVPSKPWPPILSFNAFTAASTVSLISAFLLVIVRWNSDAWMLSTRHIMRTYFMKHKRIVAALATQS